MPSGLTAIRFSREGKERKVTRALYLTGNLALVTRTGARFAARLYPPTVREEGAKRRYIFVVDGLVAIRAERTEFPPLLEASPWSASLVGICGHSFLHNLLLLIIVAARDSLRRPRCV